MFDLDLSVFLHPRFVMGYCTLILLVFSYFLFCIAIQQQRLANALNRVTNEWAKAPTKKEFPKRFEEYREKIIRQPALRRAWLEFEETLVIPPPDAGDDIFNTSDVSSYFNHTTVVSPNVSFNYYRSVPNLLTGLGILGTFLGLAAGVNAASSGLSSSDPTVITESLDQLLQGSSLAFLTSITGIFLSLIFVLINARISNHLDRLVALLADSIEATMTRVTAASVALKQLNYAEQTTRELKTFNTDLVLSIQQTLEEKIANRLSPQLAKLLEAVESLRGDRATDSENVIANMINHFSRAIHDQAGNQFDQLGETVGNLSAMLRSSTNSLTETQEKVRETLEQNTAKVAETLANTGTSIISNMTTQLQHTLKGLGSATADQFEQMNATIQGLNSIVNGLTVSLDESQMKMQTSIDHSTNTMVNAVTTAAKETTERLTSNVESSVGEIRSATKQLTVAMNATESTISELRSFSEKFRDLSDVIENTHYRISQTTSPIRDGLMAIERATTQHGELLRHSGEHLSEMRDLTVQLGQHGESVKQTWEVYHKRFDGIDESLAKVFENLDNGLTMYCETINRFVQELDTTAGNCISKLSSANSELKIAIEELGDTLEEHRR